MINLNPDQKLETLRNILLTLLAMEPLAASLLMSRDVAEEIRRVCGSIKTLNPTNVALDEFLERWSMFLSHGSNWTPHLVSMLVSQKLFQPDAISSYYFYTKHFIDKNFHPDKNTISQHVSKLQISYIFQLYQSVMKVEMSNVTFTCLHCNFDKKNIFEAALEHLQIHGGAAPEGVLTCVPSSEHRSPILGLYIQLPGQLALNFSRVAPAASLLVHPGMPAAAGPARPAASAASAASARTGAESAPPLTREQRREQVKQEVDAYINSINKTYEERYIRNPRYVQWRTDLMVMIQSYASGRSQIPEKITDLRDTLNFITQNQDVKMIYDHIQAKLERGETPESNPLYKRTMGLFTRKKNPDLPGVVKDLRRYMLNFDALEAQAEHVRSSTLMNSGRVFMHHKYLFEDHDD
jgi:hypothetical protein